MDDTLKGMYKELWIEYQNDESKAIVDLTYDQLDERIKKWESIEFEARAKRQRAIGEKRRRDEVKKKADRDALINDPNYVSLKPSPIAPGNGDYKVREPKQRKSKEEKLKESFGALGLDLGDLLKDVAAKKAGT